MASAETFLWALVGGILPAILWLLFWLREDSRAPEPRRLIAKTFIAGMLAVIVALLAEKIMQNFLTSGSFITITLFALIEEVSKFGAAYFVALKTKENNEPVDSMIYLITAALGFAALENSFFLLEPLNDGNILGGFITGNLRFVGSSLLHVIASGIIGVFSAYAFCELNFRKRAILGLGLILAVILHAFFNFFILKSGSNLFTVFGFVWMGVIIIILFFERIKRINQTCINT